MSAQTQNYNISQYFLYHKDGLLDTFFGLYLLIAGSAMANELNFLTGVWVAIFVPLWTSARKSITMSRVPPSRLPKQTGRQTTTFMATMVGLLILGILAAMIFIFGFDIYPGLRDFLATYIHLSIGAGITGLLLILSAVLSTGRLSVYALASATTFLISHMLGWPFWLSMIILGGLMAAVGLTLVVRFVTHNPLPGGKNASETR